MQSIDIHTFLLTHEYKFRCISVLHLRSNSLLRQFLLSCTVNSKGKHALLFKVCIIRRGHVLYRFWLNVDSHSILVLIKETSFGAI